MKTIDEYKKEYLKFVNIPLDMLAHKLGVSENIAVIIRVHRPEYLTKKDIEWLQEVEEEETKKLKKGGKNETT